MNSISLYLEKFKNVGIRENELTDTVVEVICDMFGKDSVSNNDVSIKNGTIRISVSGPIQNELYINKNRILETIKEKTRLNVDNLK